MGSRNWEPCENHSLPPPLRLTCFRLETSALLPDCSVSVLPALGAILATCWVPLSHSPQCVFHLLSALGPEKSTSFSVDSVLVPVSL